MPGHSSMEHAWFFNHHTVYSSPRCLGDWPKEPEFFQWRALWLLYAGNSPVSWLLSAHVTDCWCRSRLSAFWRGGKKISKNVHNQKSRWSDMETVCGVVKIWSLKGKHYSYSCSCAIPCHSCIMIFPSEVSSRVVDSVEWFIGVVGKAVWGLALLLSGNTEVLNTRALSALIFQPVSTYSFKTVLSPIGP